MEYIFALCCYLTLPQFVLQYNRVTWTFSEKVQLCPLSYILLYPLLIMSPKIADVRRTHWC